MKRYLAGAILLLSAMSTAGVAARNVSVIDVSGSSGSCCIGEGAALGDLSSYWGQSFVALGRSIRSFQFYALDNSGPIYTGPFEFRVLLVSGEPNASGVRTVLFESAPVSVPSVPNGGRYTMIDVDMSCAKLREGDRYTWIIDAYTTRDNVLDVGQLLTTTPGEVGYTDGEFYTLIATGQGQTADLGSVWNDTGYDIAFHMAFYNEPTTPVPSLVDPNQIQSVVGTCRVR